MKIGQKEYTEVAERVKIFRNDYKGWKLQTEMVHYEPSVRVVFKATVYNDQGVIESTGFAEEEKGEPVLSNGRSNINYDNYVEIAETSAIGRALGFIGIGINSGIASADEVVNAVYKQESRINKSTAVQSQDIKWWDGESEIQLFDHFIVDGITYKTMKNKTTGLLFGLATDESVPQDKKFYKF